MKTKNGVSRKFPSYNYPPGTEVEVLADPGEVGFAGPDGSVRVCDSPVLVRYPDGEEGWVSQSELVD